MSKIIRLRKLEQKMNDAHLLQSLPWNYRILNGIDEIKQFSDLSEYSRYFTQNISGGMIGCPCLRKCFYQYHQAAIGNLTGRELRLFGLGHTMEQLTLANLHAVDQSLLSLDPDTENKQFKYINFKGKYLSKIDGLLPDGLGKMKEPIIVEIKSCKTEKFVKFIKKGVREVDTGYFSQCQAAMDLHGNCKRVVFIAINKNDSRVYCELIKLDKSYAEFLRNRAKFLIDNPYTLPEKTRFFCSYCDYKAVCDGGKPLKRCRSCEHYNWDNNTCIVTGEDVKYGKTCDDYKLTKPFKTGLFS